MHRCSACGKELPVTRYSYLVEAMEPEPGESFVAWLCSAECVYTFVGAYEQRRALKRAD